MKKRLDSYLTLDVYRQGCLLCTLVWCGKKNWIQIEAADTHGFRDVVKFAHSDAWRVQDKAFWKAAYSRLQESFAMVPK